MSNHFPVTLQTVAMSYLAAFVSMIYSIEVILIVIGMTAAVTTIIVFVATFSKVYLFGYLCYIGYPCFSIFDMIPVDFDMKFIITQYY